VPWRGKAGHVDADLADDALGSAALDAGDRAQQFNRQRERADLLLDHHAELLDLLIEEIDVAQDRSDPQPVMGVEVAGQRLLELADLRPQPPDGELREHVGIGLAGDERVEHRAPDLPMMSDATVSSLIPVSSLRPCAAG
jgi:hypothetical protein